MRLEEGINKSEEKNSKKNTYSDLTNLTKNDIVAVIEQFSEQERDWILEELVRGKRIQEMKELSITTPKLENSNFRLSNSITKNWIKKEEIGIIKGIKTTIRVKENPKGDIWEYVDGVEDKFIGEQLFTWDAAIRETKKSGKDMPYIDVYSNDFQRIMDCIDGADEQERYHSFLIENNIQFTGFRYPGGAFVGIGDEGNIWSKNQYGGNSAWYSQFLKDSWLRIEYHKCLAFSVRCCKKI